LSEEEALFQEVIHSDAQFTSNGDTCGKILETEPWCSVVLTVTRVTRPEWTSLFPTTKFFLVKRNVLGQETGFQSNWLIAKQEHQQFTVDTFDKLLTTDGITVTDQNRELIAKAFVSMKLADYLEAEITFSNCGGIDKPAAGGMRYNYGLRVWTAIQGLTIDWGFLYYKGELFRVGAYDLQKNSGNYIPVSFQKVPLPSWEDLTYRHTK
jgi:hypothetical protein